MTDIVEDKSVWDQLEELKALTLRTGAISEAQVMQLKVWAHLTFNCIVEIQIIVENNPSVTFIPESPFTISNEITENILKGLDRSVKALLGDQFGFFVKNTKNEVIFSSYGSKVNPKQLKLIHD